MRVFRRLIIVTSFLLSITLLFSSCQRRNLPEIEESTSVSTFRSDATSDRQSSTDKSDTSPEETSIIEESSSTILTPSRSISPLPQTGPSPTPVGSRPIIPSNTPTPALILTPVPTSTPTTAMPTSTPTPRVTPTPTAIPTSTPRPVVTVLPLPTATPTSTPKPTTTPLPIPTVTSVPTPPAIQSPDGRTSSQLSSPYTVNGLVLVNKQHWVNSIYAPLPASLNIWNLQNEAMAAWHQLKNAAASQGLNLRFVSGYRTYAYQEWLFNDYASKDPGGVASASRYSARPGQSEHQTGLALDIDNGQVGLTAAFANTAEGKWLWENAWRYGWILRYPQGKEHITGYIFEPWHYRYVGTNTAALFGANSSLTLEEFLDELPSKYGQ